MKTNIPSLGKRGSLKKVRTSNIQTIRDLDRDELEHGSREKQILIHVTTAGEKLFIRFPGKESTWEGEKKRPWDFRPKLMKDDGSYIDDLSFTQIWDILFEVLEPIKSKQAEVLRALAAVFCRMAYMSDHRLVEDIRTFKVVSCHIKEDGQESFFDNGELKLPSYHEYCPDSEIIDALNSHIPKLYGISLEGYLFYNDLLAWNEDCKYYYRQEILKGTELTGGIGRPNNLLTHVCIIGLILGDIKLSALLGKFMNQRGVAPAINKEIAIITGGLVGNI